MSNIKRYTTYKLVGAISIANIARSACLPAFALSLAVLPIAVQANSIQTYVIDTYGGEALLTPVRQQLNSTADGGTASVYQDKLILRTTSRNYQMIQQLLVQIDRQPQALTVAVRVGNIQDSQSSTRQGQVIITNRGIQGSGIINQRSSQQQSNNLYQVQTLSGSAASISTGTLYSLYNTNIYSSYTRPSRQIIIQNQVLLPTSRGIAVLPRLLSNGQVEVTLSQVEETLAKNGVAQPQSPYRQHSYGNSMVDAQRLNSTFIVPRGQWVTIGQISQTSISSGSRTTSSNNNAPIALLVQ